MADGSLGEPLPLRTAVAKWSAQSAYLTAVTPATSLGAVRARHNKMNDVIALRGPGSPSIVARTGGSVSTEWTLAYAGGVQTGLKTFLTKAVRAAGVLPYFTLGLGWEDDVSPTSNKDADQIQDCVVNSLEMTLDAFSGIAPLTATLSGPGGLVTALTSLTKGTLSTTPWASNESVLLMEGAAYQAGRLSFSVNHNVSKDYIIPGAAPASFHRGFKYLSVHDEVITGTVERYAKLGHSIQGTTIAEKDISWVFTNANDAVTLTIALTDAIFSNEEYEQTDQGLRWRADFECKTWSAS